MRRSLAREARREPARALARRPDGAPPPAMACYHAVAVAMLAHNVLPARLSEAARALTLSRAGGVQVGEAAGAVVLGRVLDLVALIAVTSLPALVLGLRSLERAAALGAIAAAVLVLALWLLYRARARVRAWTGWAAPIGRAAGGFADGLSALASPRRLVAAGAPTLAVPAIAAFAYACALHAFGLGALPPGAALALTAAIYLAVAVPSAPSAVGVYHAAVTWLLVTLGAPPAQAAALAIGAHATSTLTLIACGAVSLARVGMPRRSG
jgi:uncharacterized membrane protein YbhN (UPF0104 family)